MDSWNNSNYTINAAMKIYVQEQIYQNRKKPCVKNCKLGGLSYITN